MASRRIFQTTRKALGAASSRNLNLHEHMSVDLLREYGIKVPEGRVAHSAAEAKELAAQLPTNDVVVKAQVLAGGRGKGHFDNGFQGGVHVCYGADDVEKVASNMLGANLITKQTGAEGRPCNKVFLCERRYPRREYYCSISMDRGTGVTGSKFGPVLVASAAGGMNIEEVAASNPELIIKHHIDINSGLSQAEALDIAKKTGFPEATCPDAADFFIKLYKLFCEKDCTTV